MRRGVAAVIVCVALAGFSASENDAKAAQMMSRVVGIGLSRVAIGDGFADGGIRMCAASIARREQPRIPRPDHP
jgi:hypothetical protein